MFPSVVVLGDGTLLAVYRVASGKDTPDETIEMRRSRDCGRTWSGPEQPFGPDSSIRCCYVTPLGDRRLLAVAMWIDRRSFPGQPLFNPETEGCLPAAIVVSDSDDSGQSWTPFRRLSIPEELGPPSLTDAAVPVGAGRLAISIETNKPYLDTGVWRQRVVHVHSSDGGATWGTPVTVSEDTTRRIFYWDQRLVATPDGRLASFSWTYDREARTYLEVHRRLSEDEGASWSSPEALGFSDQPGHPAVLEDGRTVLPWVDRFGSNSLKARMAQAIDRPFEPATEVLLYQGSADRHDGANLLSEMSLWTFGLPHATALPSGEVLITYYAGSPSCMDVRFELIGVTS